MRELEDKQHASQIQNLSELTEIEMKLAVLQTPAKEPEWIYGLAAVAQMPEIPHQDILSLSETIPRTPKTSSVTNTGTS